jgi:hypothetical protein
LNGPYGARPEEPRKSREATFASVATLFVVDEVDSREGGESLRDSSAVLSFLRVIY